MNWKELFTGKDRLSDFIPWLLADREQERILTRSGGVLRVAKLELPDLESASPEALIEHHRRISLAFARFGRGWSIACDQWRIASPGYLPDCHFEDNHAAKLIEDSRKRQFTDNARPPFNSASFLSVHYQPQQRDAFLSWIMGQPNKEVSRHLRFFDEHTDALFSELGVLLPGLTKLCSSELASYLLACITYEPGFSGMSVGNLQSAFAARDWYTRETPLRIDQQYLATVELRGFGSPNPLTCERLHELPFQARWVTTFHGLDIDGRRKEIETLRKRWLAKQRGLGAIVEQMVTRIPYAGRTNPEADLALSQLENLLGNVQDLPFALAHSNVHVWHKDQVIVGENAGFVASTLKANGIDARQATLNAVWAPLADIPGNVDQRTRNVRRQRFLMPAITRLSPLTGVSVGHREDTRFKGPALMVGLTRRGVPYYWSLNAPGQDQAHTAVIGTNGSGKSFLLSMMAAQFLRYDGSRVVLYDRRRSFMVACLCLGGDWIELGDGSPAVQPLRWVDEPASMVWAHDWVMRALALRGLPQTPHTASAVTDALQHVATLAPDERTLTSLWTYLSGDSAARIALQHYLRAGPFGKMLDGVVPSYGSARVLAFETHQIVQQRGDIGPLVLSANFHAMQRERLQGDGPKLVLVDEAWSMFRHPLFAGEIEGWARELRKLQAVLVLSSQSLTEFATEAGRVVWDQLTNKVFTPQPTAMRPQSAELYRAVGMLDEQIRLVATAQPKQEYLLLNDEVGRLLSIVGEGDALRICGSSRPEDHARAKALLDERCKPGEEFTRAWLAETSRDWLARKRAKGQAVYINEEDNAAVATLTAA